MSSEPSVRDQARSLTSFTPDTRSDVAGSVLRRLWNARHELRNISPALNARFHLRTAEWQGWRVRLWGRPHVVNAGRISLGDRVRIDSTVARIELRTLPGGLIEIGDNVFINYGSSLVASAHVIIRDGCLIGPHVMIWDTDYHRVEDKAWDPSGLPILLEERVWVATRATILKGVTVGHDAVVAAGAVVVRDVPPRTVVAGVPAQVVREF
jgi:acetyltransferase-like isoleucine patch superfamily enzyme